MARRLNKYTAAAGRLRGAAREQPLLAAGTAALVAVAAGAVLLPDLVWDRFLWQYFWGPVVADATPGTSSVVRHGVEAHAGYTLVNEIGYGLLLGYLLLLLVTVLRRFDIGTGRGFILPFVPFVVGGGLLRVVEDAVSAGLIGIGVPWRYLLISPVIYLTMFGIVFTTLLAALLLQRRGVIADYGRAVAGTGTAFAFGTAAWLVAAGGAPHLWVLGAVLAGTAVVGGAAVLVVRRLEPRFPRLGHVTTGAGLAVLFGYLVDGVSTAVSFELVEFTTYTEKHPVVAAFIHWTGSAYWFVVLKLVVIVGILAVMDDEMRRDDPVFFNLVLLAVLAVGLGPGTRNTMRAVLGI